VPAYLLARLALDLSLQGQGLGGELLVDALGRIVAAADVAGGRLIVVDAIDEAAAAFYARHDFRSVRGAAASVSPRRMAMKIATARSALGVSRP
jgi:predicted N-acetyltransferase YhbS